MKFLIFIFLIFFNFVTNGQEVSIQVSDSIKIEFYLTLENQEEIEPIDNIKRLESFEDRIINKNANETQKIRYYIKLADLYLLNGDYDKSLDLYYKGFQIAETISADSLLCDLYNKIGTNYAQKGFYSDAVDYFLIGAKFSFDRKLKNQFNNFNIQLGNLNLEIDNFQDAKYYFDLAIENMSKNSDFNLYAEAIFGLAFIQFENNNFQACFDNLNSIKYIKNPKIHHLVHCYLAKSLIKLGKFNTVENYFIYSLQTIKNQNLNLDFPIINKEFGDFYLLIKDTSNARKYLFEALNSSNKFRVFPKKIEIYSSLYNFYKFINKLDSALFYLEMVDLERKEFISMENNKKIANALTKYKSDQKEKENNLLKKDLEIIEQKEKRAELLNYFLISLSLVVLLITLFIFYRYHAKNKLNKKLIEKNDEISKQNEELETLNYEISNRNIEIQQINDNLILSEIKLKESNITKNKFLSIIAHDLKNPVAGLMLSSELMLSYYDKLTPEKLYDRIKEFNMSSLKLKELLEGLLNWADIHKDNLNAIKEQFLILPIVESLKKLFETQLSIKKIKLKINIDPNQMVFADKKMVETVIRNLISNAIKFTPVKGEIIVRVTEFDSEYVEISIKDSGVGISPEIIPMLFDSSKRFTSEGTNKERGTGLGLSLCKEFVEVNGGRIDLHTELGKGSNFYFTLLKERIE